MSIDESSATVQREAEHERAELVSTLERLRDNLRPEHVVDEVMAGAKINVSEISDKLIRTARANPIPAVLIGLGAAMLLGVGAKAKSKAVVEDHEWSEARLVPVVGTATRNDARGSTEHFASSPSPRTETLKSSMAGKLDVVGAHASAAAERIADSAGALRAQASDLRSQASSKIKSYARSTRDGVTSTSGDRVMNQYSKSKDQVVSKISVLLDEQPLVLAALGIAVGAAIGSAIPATEIEGRLMGDASASVKSSAQDLAQEQYRHLKDKAGETLDDLKKTAADRGVSTDNIAGLVQDVGGKVRDAAVDVANHAADTAKPRV